MVLGSACRILVFASLAAGCTSTAEVDDIITAPLALPTKGSLADQQIVVPKGRVLAFVAQPMGQDETLKQRIRLASRDSSIAGVDKTVEMNQFVVLGVSVGTTELTVTDESGRPAKPTFQVTVIDP